MESFHGGVNYQIKGEKLKTTIYGNIYPDQEAELTNKNDIVNLLGRPSTKSTFDNDVWIYIERKTSTGSIIKMGKKKLLVNNVLVLEINEIGLLASIEFYDKESMNDIKITENQTDPVYKKRSFVYDFLSSMRQKINDPLGKRIKKD